ncbi:MAG: phosphatase PAP2 family protein [Patescibacteria group bacterium UBA2163]
MLFKGLIESAILFIIAFLTTFAIVTVIKNTVRTPRPRNAAVATVGYSFPSGHAAAGGFFATSISYLMAQQFSGIIVLLVSALVVGIGVSIAVSRVFLRAHTIPQILVGLIIGVSVPLIIFHYQHTLLLFIFG